METDLNGQKYGHLGKKKLFLKHYTTVQKKISDPPPLLAFLYTMHNFSEYCFQSREEGILEGRIY